MARHRLPRIIRQDPEDRELRSSQRYDVAALIYPPDFYVDHEIIEVAWLHGDGAAVQAKTPECLPYSHAEHVVTTEGDHGDPRYQWRQLCIGERDYAAPGGLANTVEDGGAVLRWS
ncbi:hypothetical protein [Mycolicibacterium poriferae]|uniref:hypothetical protein n=1 Tax=Mycolicibacterium poriferae TaxID=39694 RepID=UPI0024B90542|nr:hypothetical protein [Mycolicibacterium poriferae]